MGIDWPTYTATEARANFADIFDAVCFGHPCYITKNGRRAVAMIPIEMFRALEKYEDELEGRPANE